MKSSMMRNEIDTKWRRGKWMAWINLTILMTTSLTPVAAQGEPALNAARDSQKAFLLETRNADFSQRGMEFGDVNVCFVKICTLMAIKVS
jgi:hypothetical protein